MSSDLERARNELLAALDFLDDVVVLDSIANNVSNAAACCAQVGGSAAGVVGELAAAEGKLTEASNIIAAKILELRGLAAWLQGLIDGGL